MKKIKLGLLALIGLLLSMSTAVLAEESSPIALTVKETLELTPQLEKEILCLAKNIFYEAGGEPYNGKVAVAQVSVNRVRDGRFPDSVCEVIKQKTVVSRPRQIESVKKVTTGWGIFQKTEQHIEVKTVVDKKTVCQFSWYCTAKAKKAPPMDSENYQESLEVARRVLLEGFGLNHLRDALYFHATHVNPKWGKPKVAKIGNHVFYRDHQ